MNRFSTKVVFLAGAFIFVAVASFTCGVYSVGLRRDLMLRDYDDKELTYPPLKEDDYLQLVGTWVLTDDSLERFRIMMERIDERCEPPEDLARDVFPTCQQMMLTAKRFDNDAELIGTRDTWPLLKDGGFNSSAKYICLDAQFIFWKIRNDISPEDASQIEGGVSTRANSWLLISLEWAPDLWKSNVYAIGKRGDALVLRTELRFDQWEQRTVLEWRKISDTREGAATLFSKGSDTYSEKYPLKNKTTNGLNTEPQKQSELAKKVKSNKAAREIVSRVESKIRTRDVEGARFALNELTPAHLEVVSHNRRSDLGIQIDKLDEHLKKTSVAAKKAGERKLINIGGKEVAFRWCPPTGEDGFMMGCNNERGSERPVHKVVLTKGFWMGETEVTQGMWEDVMKTTIEQQKDKAIKYMTMKGVGEDYPMYFVSWEDCQEFIKKLNTRLPKGVEASMPTEAQWEYACRAWSGEKYPGNLESMAWYGEDRGTGSAHPVGLKQPNAWGIKDMHGNVTEWCVDKFDVKYYSTAEARRDPTGGDGGSYRVSRGGRWHSIARNCRSTSRLGMPSNFRGNDIGFRVSLQEINE